MKHKLCIILLSILVTLWGCGMHEQETHSGSLRFYYLQNETAYNSSNSVVSYETIQADKSTPVELIAQYLLGPTKEELTSPFPEDLKLISITQEENNVAVVLSGELSDLSGIELTLACSCLARTLQSIFPADSYEISTAEGKLNGKSSILITSETFVWEDTIPEL